MREAGVLLGAGRRRRPRLAVAARADGDDAAVRAAAGRSGDAGDGGRRRSALVAMLASYLPALRASRLEPTEALREE